MKDSALTLVGAGIAGLIQRRGLPRTLPGLEGFPMVGHWITATIGVSTDALEGRNLIKELCKQDGRPFRSTKI